MNAALTWTGPLARTGRHRRPGLIWRAARRFLGHTEPEKNAGRGDQP